MKVLLLGEGASERSGALQTLVKRLAPIEFEIHVDLANRKDVHAHHGKGQGFFKRAVRWMFEAKKRGYDALILVIDEDGRRESIREFEEAQQSVHADIRRALGVAIRTFDAWMLADERALSTALGVAVSRQKSPESIPDPRHVCERLRNDSNFERLPEMYAAIADAISIETLIDRCPRGFAPFAERVRRL